ncbi:hypothetical protein BJY01DRAFT_225518 [Aspergillus pseudoustus]|uniref:Amidase domain-containing protein n=1 Tax=Aspergillus pseudoustus TaxID=1810923 RepID=A0ABR4IZ94_9EURO
MPDNAFWILWNPAFLTSFPLASLSCFSSPNFHHHAPNGSYRAGRPVSGPPFAAPAANAAFVRGKYSLTVADVIAATVQTARELRALKPFLDPTSTPTLDRSFPSNRTVSF